MNGRIGFTELVSLIRDLVQQRKTATVFVKTVDNHSIVIGLSEGDITSLACGLHRGLSAIPMVRKMGAGTYRLEADAPTTPSPGLPATADLLAALEGGKTLETEVASGVEWGAGAIDPARVRDALCRLMHEFIGPIAHMVCEDTEQEFGGLQDAAAVGEFINRLSREIADPAESRQFVAAAHAKLKDMLA